MQSCGYAGVIDVLTEALKDKNERVRRRIMATLGELLFYVATQQQVHSRPHVHPVLPLLLLQAQELPWGDFANPLQSVGSIHHTILEWSANASLRA